VKCFIDCVQCFRARDLAFGGSGDQRLRRAEAQAVGVGQAGVFGSCSIRKYAQPATSVHQASAVATFARAVSDQQRSTRQPGNLNVDTFRITALMLCRPTARGFLSGQCETEEDFPDYGSVADQGMDDRHSVHNLHPGIGHPDTKR
jgi:hypothetical protein